MTFEIINFLLFDDSDMWLLDQMTLGDVMMWSHFLRLLQNTWIFLLTIVWYQTIFQMIHNTFLEFMTKKTINWTTF